VHFEPFSFTKVVTQMQLLSFSALTFFVFLPMLKRTDTIVLDSDLVYRKGGNWFMRFISSTLNGLNAKVHSLVVGKWITALASFFKQGPSRLLIIALTPVWKFKGIDEKTILAKKQDLYERTRLGAFPVGLTAVLAVVLLALLFLF
jgi:multicomponent Na+:H+ antiporter subunit D